MSWHFGTKFRHLDPAYAFGVSTLAKAFCVCGMSHAEDRAQVEVGERIAQKSRGIRSSGCVFDKLCRFVSMEDECTQLSDTRGE
jgi:hypothetical protein